MWGAWAARGAAMSAVTARRERVATTRAVGVVAGGLTCASLPAFLTGALSAQIGETLGTSAAAVGGGATAFFLAGAAASVPGGRLTDRIGATAAVRAGATISGIAVLGIATLVDAWWQLIVLLALAGTAMSLIDPGGARILGVAVPRRRQGLGFGIKEASVTLASLLAGVAVPALGATAGWRPAFILGLVVAVAVLVAVPGGIDPPAPGPRRLAGGRAGAGRPHVAADDPRVAADAGGPAAEVPRRPLLLAAVGAALGGGAATAAATFLVPAGLSAGLGPSAAGALLAVASGTAIVTRLAAGHRADTARPDALRSIVVLQLAGALGMGLLIAPGILAAVTGSVLALGAGWGWTGLLFLAAVRLAPQAPGRASGTVLAGLGVGGALGPAVFATVTSSGSYTLAWTLAAAAMLAGAVASHGARRAAA